LIFLHFVSLQYVFCDVININDVLNQPTVLTLKCRICLRQKID